MRLATLPGTAALLELAPAQSELRMARLDEKSDILPEQICFHAQQAVEKAFKAVLLHRKINFPLTNDLEELLAVFERAGLAVPSEFEGVGALTPYAVETRYPGFWGEMGLPGERQCSFQLLKDFLDIHFRRVLG